MGEVIGVRIRVRIESSGKLVFLGWIGGVRVTCFGAIKCVLIGVWEFGVCADFVISFRVDFCKIPR